MYRTYLVQWSLMPSRSSFGESVIQAWTILNEEGKIGIEVFFRFKKKSKINALIFRVLFNRTVRLFKSPLLWWNWISWGYQNAELLPNYHIMKLLIEDDTQDWNKLRFQTLCHFVNLAQAELINIIYFT